MKLLKWTGDGVPECITVYSQQIKDIDHQFCTSIFRGETLVSVGEDVLVFVALPLVEHIPGIHIVRVVLAAVPGQVHHVVRLEVDLLVTVSQALVPGDPVLPAGLALLRVGKADVAEDELDRPEAADIEHGVCVVLVLGSTVQQLATALLLPHYSLVEAGRVENVAGLQPQIFPGKNLL